MSYKLGSSALAGMYYHPCVLFSIGSPGDEPFRISLETPALGVFADVSQSLILSAVGYLGAFRAHLRAL